MPIRRWPLYKRALTAAPAVAPRSTAQGLQTGHHASSVGRTVKDVIVRELLFQELPLATAGDMTQIAATLAADETLFQLALAVHLDKFVASDLWVRASRCRVVDHSPRFDLTIALLCPLCCCVCKHPAVPAAHADPGERAARCS